MSESIKRGDRVRVAFEGEVSDVDTPGFGVTYVLENGQADYKWFGSKFIKDTGLTVEKIAPPKPSEPIGLGAVVEDADGTYFVRVQTHYTSPWVRQGVVGNSALYRYADIPVIKVLSEGVDL